jgi:acyl-CoA synthetase (AMP-forming)/AMP-acid ligase II
MTARDRTGAAALMGAAITGLIAFALFLAGGLLLWANGHYKDADGYLSITGRLKEIINRGGEKVSPREVDEILMDHPAVAQVVCFGMPHPKLGEEVAAVVVLREGQPATERELQAFVSTRAADYKVPKKILFMDEIPKGATGKLQRIGLAQKLGLG